MATAHTKLMTFAEFALLPDDPNGWHQELRNGEIVTVPPPLHGHFLVQRRLRRLLDQLTGGAGEVETELGYRPTPDHNYWEADVAFVARNRWDQIPLKGNLQGPPELVIEVLSDSNTIAEMRDKRRICLENGGREFWVIDQDHREVEVSTPDGRTVTYKAGEQIPLFFADGARIPVDGIFG